MKIKTTEIEYCFTCPDWKKCGPSKKLTQKQRLFMTISSGAVKILKDCPLPDAQEVDGNEERK